MGDLPFGPIAEQYDRVRPSPPEGLVDDLERLARSVPDTGSPPERGPVVLDVGCGTGKAAVALAERGLTVLGLEPDPQMAAIARGHGIPVELGAFEAWDPAGRSFDLITFADSWHWMDPLAAVPRVAALLRPGGTVARFWNEYVLDPEVLDAFDPIYRRHAPDLVGTYRPRHNTAADPFEQDGNFAAVPGHIYKAVSVRTADEWVATVATTSDHRRLGEHLPPLLSEVHEAIEGLGGAVRAHRTTHLALSRRL